MPNASQGQVSRFRPYTVARLSSSAVYQLARAGNYAARLAAKRAGQLFRQWRQQAQERRKKDAQVVAHQPILDPNEMKIWGWSMSLGPPLSRYGDEGKIIYDAFYSRVHEGPAGKQALDDVANLLNIDSFIPVNSEAYPKVTAPVAWARHPEGLFTLHPSYKEQLVTGDNAENPEHFDQYINSDRYVKIHSIANNITYKNLVEYPVEVKVYWCLARQDQKDGPTLTWWNDDKQGQEAQNPTIEVNGVNPGYTRPDNVGQSPLYSNQFKRYWKVLKCDSFLLQGGASAKINSTIYFNKKITWAKVKEKLTKYTGPVSAPTGDYYYVRYMAGITVVPMIVLKGSAQWAVPPGVLAYAPPKIGLLAEQRYVMSYGEVSSAPNVRRVYPNLYFAAKADAMEDIRIMNKEGEVEVPEELHELMI